MVTVIDLLLEYKFIIALLQKPLSNDELVLAMQQMHGARLYFNFKQILQSQVSNLSQYRLLQFPCSA